MALINFRIVPMLTASMMSVASSKVVVVACGLRSIVCLLGLAFNTWIGYQCLSTITMYCQSIMMDCHISPSWSIKDYPLPTKTPMACLQPSVISLNTHKFTIHMTDTSHSTLCFYVWAEQVKRMNKFYNLLHQSADQKVGSCPLTGSQVPWLQSNLQWVHE